MLNKILLLSSFFLIISFACYGQQKCCNYTTWTRGMWIGPGSNCNPSNYGGQTVSYQGRLYTHRGYCSSSGPGTWDFLDIGPCVTGNGLGRGNIGNPQNLTAPADPATITNTNTGGADSYQWQFSDNSATGPWTPIPGQTNSTYNPACCIIATRWYRRRGCQCFVEVDCNPNWSSPVEVTVTSQRRVIIID